MKRILHTTKPNPGSTEALENNCTCPVIDNHYGRGHHGITGEFVYNMDCPLHTMELDNLKELLGITHNTD